MIRSFDQDKGNRPVTAGGDLKLGVLLLAGLAGATIGAIAALAAGYGFVAVATAYAGGGVAAMVLAAVTLFLSDRPNDHDG